MIFNNLYLRVERCYRVKDIVVVYGGCVFRLVDRNWLIFKNVCLVLV